MSTSGQVNEMLRTARSILAGAGDNVHLLGHALSQFHSALEQHFRSTLARNDQVPESLRIRLGNSKEIDRIQLLELMMTYGGLSATDAQAIRDFNRLRNRIQHDNTIFRGTRQQVEQYADRVERIITGTSPALGRAQMTDELFEAQLAMLGITPPRSPATQQPTPSQTTNRPAKEQRRETASQTAKTISNNLGRNDVARNSSASGRPPSGRAPRADDHTRSGGALIGDWFMYALIGLLILGVIWRLLS